MVVVPFGTTAGSGMGLGIEPQKAGEELGLLVEGGIHRTPRSRRDVKPVSETIR